MDFDFDFKGRTALVVGGGRGIGRACAEWLGARGARVAVAARTTAQVEEAEEAITAAGGTALACTLDVTDAAAVAAIGDIVEERWGAIDTLINAAGVAESAPLKRTSDELWDRALEVNVTGAFRLVRALLPGMAERGFGRVVMVASVAAKAGAPYVAAYAASKHALLGLVRSAALESARAGVTVNAVCPGFVDTPMTAASIANIVQQTGCSEAEARGRLEGFSPQRRLFTPAEIAHAVGFLASREAGGITGQGLNVDGGGTQW
jgi:NAD(P)-dependent dehydrogenase (short-subunit alcohol dehydrogenase family)